MMCDKQVYQELEQALQNLEIPYEPVKENDHYFLRLKIWDCPMTLQYEQVGEEKEIRLLYFHIFVTAAGPKMQQICNRFSTRARYLIASVVQNQICFSYCLVESEEGWMGTEFTEKKFSFMLQEICNELMPFLAYLDLKTMEDQEEVEK